MRTIAPDLDPCCISCVQYFLADNDISCRHIFSSVDNPYLFMCGHSQYSHSGGLFLLLVADPLLYAYSLPPALPTHVLLHILLICLFAREDFNNIMLSSILVYLISVMYLCKCNVFVLMWWVICPILVFFFLLS